MTVSRSETWARLVERIVINREEIADLTIQVEIRGRRIAFLNVEISEIEEELRRRYYAGEAPGDWVRPPN